MGVETGINFAYYPAGVLVTATDQSERVITQAKVLAKANRIEANFIVAPPDTLQLPERSFDTIVSTFPCLPMKIRNAYSTNSTGGVSQTELFFCLSTV